MIALTSVVVLIFIAKMLQWEPVSFWAAQYERTALWRHVSIVVVVMVVKETRIHCHYQGPDCCCQTRTCSEVRSFAMSFLFSAEIHKEEFLFVPMFIFCIFAVDYGDLEGAVGYSAPPPPPSGDEFIPEWTDPRTEAEGADEVHEMRRRRLARFASQQDAVSEEHKESDKAKDNLALD